jgi:hypothetical protein
MDDKTRPIQQKYIGDEQMRRDLMVSRTEIRTIYGEKMMREVLFD